METLDLSGAVQESLDKKPRGRKPGSKTRINKTQVRDTIAGLVEAGNTLAKSIKRFAADALDPDEVEMLTAALIAEAEHNEKIARLFMRAGAISPHFLLAQTLIVIVGRRLARRGAIPPEYADGFTAENPPTVPVDARRTSSDSGGYGDRQVYTSEFVTPSPGIRHFAEI